MKKFILLLGLLALPLYASNQKATGQSEVVIVRPLYFEQVYDSIRTLEGNYSFVVQDKGGETYGGITRSSYSKWYGWKYIDLHKRRLKVKSLPHNYIVPEAEMWVKDFYLDIWVKEGFDQITDYTLALYLFDTRIHHRSAPLLINRVLSQMDIEPYSLRGRDFADRRWIDDRILSIDSKEFILRLSKRRMMLYYNLVLNDDSQKVFLRGWLRRAG